MYSEPHELPLLFDSIKKLVKGTETLRKEDDYDTDEEVINKA